MSQIHIKTLCGRNILEDVNLSFGVANALAEALSDFIDHELQKYEQDLVTTKQGSVFILSRHDGALWLKEIKGPTAAVRD